MNGYLVDSLLLFLLYFFNFFEVGIWCIGFPEVLWTLWYYGKALGNVAVISTITALKLELGFLEIDFHTMFS